MTSKSIVHAVQAYESSVGRRVKAEEKAFTLSEQKLQAEAELRDARDDERRKLIAVEEAVENDQS